MAVPVTTITLGGTDISAYVGTPDGGTSLTFGRGANFEGSSEGPGTAVITVRNDTHRFDQANAGSSLASVLKIGKEVRCTAVYSATTYGLFHGYLRRIVPLENGFAELHCEDALWKYSRVQTSRAVERVNTYSSLRGILLDDIGETAARRTLAPSGIESGMIVSGYENVSALAMLESINRACGSIHFIDPQAADPPGYVYHVRSRDDLQTAASAETFTDTDLSLPFAIALGGYDYTDEAVINSQRVVAHNYTMSPKYTTVWTSPELPFTLVAGEARDIWVDLPMRLIDITALVNTTGGGTAAVNVTTFLRSVLIQLSVSAGTVTWTQLAIQGQLVFDDPTAWATSTDSTSQTAYGVLAGQDVDESLVSTVGEAKGLGNWVIYRYKDPRAKPTMTIENRHPSMLQREVGDRITLTSSVYSIAARPYFIRHLNLSISDSGNVWRATYELEEAPAIVSAVTVGGSAAQGVGGTAILGY